MPDFSIPLSGLTASSTALATISNNLANLNTLGYKEASVTFSDLFYRDVGTSGDGNPMQIGAGTAVSTISSNFNPGSVETTGNPRDVAISGNGFFVTQSGSGYDYTRAGNFAVNSAGYLTASDGSLVMGYPAVNGVVSTNGGIGPLQVGEGQISPPRTTSELQLKVNLNSGASTTDAAYTTPVTVYDSLGNSHVITFQFSKTAANTWAYTVTAPSSDLASGSGTSTTLTSGTFSFDGNGKLILPTDASGNPLTQLTVTIPGLGDGANDLSFNWQLQDSNGNGFLTQLASASSTASTFQDGYGSGTLQDFTIASDGTIQGSFTNGNQVLGQIALASFANVQGLSREGGSNFRETLASGQAVIGAPGTSGRGTLSGGSLENSNVDISAEFSNLIIAQRGFEANAKAITTFDEVMQDTIQLKR